MFAAPRVSFTLLAVVSLTPGCFTNPPPPAPTTPLARAIAKVENSPGFASYIELGLVRLSNQEPELALSAFRRAAEISPDAPIAHNNLCSTYNQLKRWNEAIASCRRALAIEPEFVLAKNNLAEAERNLR